jgi:hypothetical protein
MTTNQEIRVLVFSWQIEVKLAFSEPDPSSPRRDVRGAAGRRAAMRQALAIASSSRRWRRDGAAAVQVGRIRPCAIA